MSTDKSQLEQELEVSEQAFMEAQKDRTAEQQKVSIPLAIEILQFLVSISDLEKGIGIKKQEEKDEFWVKTAEKFIISLRQKHSDIKLTDLGYAFKAALEAVNQLQGIVDGTIAEKEAYVVNKYFGVDYKYELDLRKLEEKEAVYRKQDYDNYIQGKSSTKKVVKSPLKKKILTLVYKLIGKKG